MPPFELRPPDPEALFLVALANSATAVAGSLISFAASTITGQPGLAFLAGIPVTLLAGPINFAAFDIGTQIGQQLAVLPMPKPLIFGNETPQRVFTSHTLMA